jgi:hypothetical protein
MARAPKGTPTDTNLYALDSVLRESPDGVIRRMAPTDIPHVKRVLAAGYLEPAGGRGEWKLTPTGKAALEDWRAKDAANKSRWAPPVPHVHVQLAPQRPPPAPRPTRPEPARRPQIDPGLGPLFSQARRSELLPRSAQAEVLRDLRRAFGDVRAMAAAGSCDRAMGRFAIEDDEFRSVCRSSDNLVGPSGCQKAQAARDRAYRAVVGCGRAPVPSNVLEFRRR